MNLEYKGEVKVMTAIVVLLFGAPMAILAIFLMMAMNAWFFIDIWNWSAHDILALPKINMVQSFLLLSLVKVLKFRGLPSKEKERDKDKLLTFGAVFMIPLIWFMSYLGIYFFS